MVKLLLANYEGKWKYDILREIYHMIHEFTKNYDYFLIDTNDYHANSSIIEAAENNDFKMEDVSNIMVIENHDEVLIHHIFKDIYEFKDILHIYADDIHKNEHLKHINYYENFCKIFVAYKEPFLKKYLEVDKEKVYWIPHAFTDDHRNSFNENPINKVLVSGKSGSIYPLRRFMIKEAALNKQKFSMLSHPNYKKFDYENLKGLQIGKNFGKALNNHVCCFTDCSSFQYILAKYFEIPASGSLLLAEDTEYGDMEKLGFIDNVNYIKCNKNNVISKVNWILNPVNANEINNIRLSGQHHVLNNHHISNRVKSMIETMHGESNISYNKINDRIFISSELDNTYTKYNFYCLFGLTRSGNRALCYWLQSMIKNSIFVNNVNDENVSYDKLSKNIITSQNTKLYSEFTIPDFSIDQTLILFYENKKINEMTTILKNSMPEKNNIIIVIRNPYNYLASKLHIFNRKKLHRNELIQNLKHDIEMWKQYYNECFMYPENVIVFDEWVISEEYRKKISKKLQLVYNSENIFKVNGRGVSLFDKNEFISPESVLTRYTIFKKDENYIKHVIEDNELKIMWNNILNMFCSSLKNTYNKMFDATNTIEKYEINYYSENVS